MLYFELLDENRKIPFKKAIIRLGDGEPIGIVHEFAENQVLIHHKAEPEFERILQVLGIKSTLPVITLELPNETDKNIFQTVETLERKGI